MTSVSAGASRGHDGAERLTRRVATFRASSRARGTVQLVTTLLPLAALFTVMYLSLERAYWLTLALTPLAAGFLVRSFIIMHDCAHGSFFPSRRANEITGFLTGLITLTPFAQWRRDHALHHASSGDLDRRGHGDVLTLTVAEYRARDWWGRLKYRAFRHPFVLFCLGPLYLLVSQRWRGRSTATKTMQVNSVHVTNAAILVVGGLLSLAFGFIEVLTVYFPALFLAAAAGIWLFYVQHQFEHTVWDGDADWNFHTAALHGSSYYDLPPVLRWFTANIGVHHVHHLSSRIPFYRLPDVLRAHPELASLGRLTLGQSLATTRLRLWDEAERRLVRFRKAA